MTGTAATRRLMARSGYFTGLMTWGSSSMAGGLPSQGSPVPCNILDHLKQTIAPLPLMPCAQGGTTSHHTRVSTGLDRPTVKFSGGRASSAGRVRISSIDHSMGATDMFSCHGTINGTAGWLRGAGNHFTWQPDDKQTRVKNGAFVSDHRAKALKGAKNGRYYHLLWAGKNNITQGGGSTVISHVDQLVPHLGGPGRVIVLGQWITQKDNSSQISGCKKVNAHQKKKYGAHFLDVQALLTSQAGLTCGPVEGLKLWGKSAVQKDIKAGRVPKALVGNDGIHLNGWGNLIVTHALIEKMKELQWL